MELQCTKTNDGLFFGNLDTSSQVPPSKRKARLCIFAAHRAVFRKRLRMCCEAKRLAAHYIDPNPFEFRLGTESRSWLSKSMPLFVRRWVRRGKKEKEVENKGKNSKSPQQIPWCPEGPSSSFFWGGRGCVEVSIASCGVGSAFHAMQWSLPIGAVPGITHCAHAVPAVLLPSHGGCGGSWLGDTQGHLTHGD